MKFFNFSIYAIKSNDHAIKAVNKRCEALVKPYVPFYVAARLPPTSLVTLIIFMKAKCELLRFSQFQPILVNPSPLSTVLLKLLIFWYFFLRGWPPFSLINCLSFSMIPCQDPPTQQAFRESFFVFQTRVSRHPDILGP